MNRAVLALLWILGAGRLAASQDAGATPSIASLRSLIETGDFGAAVSVGERLVEIDPGSSEVHDLLGRAYGRKAEDSTALSQLRLAKKARTAFARAVELDAANAAALADLATYDLRAPKVFGGSRKRADELARQVLRLDPGRGHELLGELAETGGDLSEAEAQYRLSLESSADLRGRRALSQFFVRRKRFSEARDLWPANGHPGLPEPVTAYERAGVALSSGEYLAASGPELRHALEGSAAVADPRRAEILRRLALVEERLGRKSEARAQLADALSLEPRHRAWQKDLERVSR